jgi:YD repeat-containing protein
VGTLYPDGSEVTQTYTATGQVESITDARGTTVYDYDERDRLVRLTHPSGEAIEYRYDAAGNRSAVITRVSHVAYTFDELNRLKDVLAPRMWPSVLMPTPRPSPPTATTLWATVPASSTPMAAPPATTTMR